MLDVGTGSGAIALAIADELPAAEVVAIDTSRSALGAGAQENAEALGLGERVAFELGALPAARGASTSSSPTFPTSATPTGRRWRPRSRSYEPREALLGGDGRPGPDPRAARGAGAGLGAARRGSALARSRWRWAKGRRAAVAELVAAAGFADDRDRDRDLAGIERVVVGR